MTAKQHTKATRPVDRRRIVLYAASVEERATLYLRAMKWANKHGVPAARAFSRWCMARIRADEPEPAGSGSQELEKAARSALEVWNADTYDHRAMGDALARLDRILKEDTA